MNLFPDFSGKPVCPGFLRWRFPQDSTSDSLLVFKLLQTLIEKICYAALAVGLKRSLPYDIIL